MRTLSVRALLSTISVAALAVSLGQVSLSAPKVFAGGGPALVISEINYAGSSLSSSDQWIELYNPTSSSINLATTPYTLFINGTEAATLSNLSNVIPANSYFLLARMNPAISASTLQVQPDEVIPTLNLPTHDALYQLKNSTGGVVDVADDGVGAPLAGTSVSPMASMVRTNVGTDGSLASSWVTSHTIGIGLVGTASQYGTPENSFQFASPAQMSSEVALPTGLMINESSSSLAGTGPTTIGHVVAISGESLEGMVTVVVNEVVNGTTFSQPVSVDPTTHAFSTGLHLFAGSYRFSVFSTDPYNNRSASVIVPVVDSPQSIYVVNVSLPIGGPLAAPKLGAYPAYTSASTVTLSGTVDSAASLVVSINGNQVSQEVVTPGQTTFSLPVTLIPNSVNRIEVRARDNTGFPVTSAPAIATITQDSLAPVLNTSLIKTASNPPGTADSISGQAGSAEPGTTIEVYSDAALTNKIASTTVAADGSFGPLMIGDNMYAKVYLVDRDQVGNGSTSIPLDNIIAYAGSSQPISYTVTGIGTDKATLTISPVAGAANYRLKYRVVGGSYSAPIDLCLNNAACTLQRPVINLNPGSKYTFAVAAVDQYGNESPYTEYAFSTQALPIVAPVTVATVSSAPTTAAAPAVVSPADQSANLPAPVFTPSNDSSTTATPAPTTDTTATPSPTPEAGEVKSADDTSSHNYTPWIILAVLLGLAILATAAYFYWFGGEAGESTEAAALAADRRRRLDEVESSAEDVRSTDATAPKDTKPIPPVKKDKEKRW